MDPSLELRCATKGDLPRILALVHASGLPIPGAGDPPVEFVAAVRAGEIAGCAGWERHGAQALIRSVAVMPSARGSGIGRLLIERARAELVARGVRDLTLVTLSAAEFFSRLGFRAIARDDVPEAVRASPEFAMHCCASGTWMRWTS